MIETKVDDRPFEASDSREEANDDDSECPGVHEERGSGGSHGRRPGRLRWDVPWDPLRRDSRGRTEIGKSDRRPPFSRV